MLLSELVAASQTVAASSGRLIKIATIAEALKAADPDEIAIVVSYLAGDLRQRRTGVGWASLRGMTVSADEPTLRVAEVDEAFEAMSTVAGKGSQAARLELLTSLWSRATEAEQRFLQGLLGGELRQGALEGVMVDALIKASALPAADVRRAVMLAGSIGAVATAVLTKGAEALADFGLEVGRPLRPMLASPAADMAAAFEKAGVPVGDVIATDDGAEAPSGDFGPEGPGAPDGAVAVEWKLDGIRVQVHKSHSGVQIFTRTLDEVTARMPEVVDAVSALPAETLVLDGEVIALDDAGRPRPFQVTASRTSSRVDIERLRREVPLRVFFFDVLHVDGRDLIGEPGSTRWEALSTALPEELRVPRIVTPSVKGASAFFDDTLALGHEGVVVKALGATYDAGRRGASWIKVKPRHTLDLVVLAVEWGHGRRTGLLSNLHLGARNPHTGEYVMLGKTFKGLTDSMLRWQTERLLSLKEHEDDWTVHVRPELVVEVAFDGVQTSPRYPAGMALRFARVLRYREDKPAAEADTVDTVRAIFNPK